MARRPDLPLGAEFARVATAGCRGARRTLDPMDDDAGNPACPCSSAGGRPCDRAGPFGATPVPPSLAGLPPRSVPETAPTPLQKHYVLLSVPVLVLGAIAITALELGTPLGQPARQALRR